MPAYTRRRTNSQAKKCTSHAKGVFVRLSDEGVERARFTPSGAFGTEPVVSR
jgi:hypothetical protein